MQNSSPSVVILISGRGSNLNALIDLANQTAAYSIRAVISNRPAAAGLALAQAHGLKTAVVDHTAYESRGAFDAALAEEINRYSPDWVVLAGFMRVLTEGFVNQYQGRLINIHPSLLPAFPGLKTHQQALAAGVRLHGVTVHLVTPELDHGPIIDQAAVQVLPEDTPESLAERVLALEHQIYPRALAALATGQIKIVNGRLEGTLSPALIHSIQT
jgi:phosphoribosylglycinamide formyltransferase 1